MFAKIYDLLMADVDYDQVYQLIEPYIKSHHRILDAGCGTGYLLEILVQKNFDVIGIDIDDEMLAVSRSKVPDHLLYHHDLKKPLGQRFDVIISLFDVMNYFKGVKQVFKNIKNALNDQGVFIFDIYKKEVLKTYQNYHEVETEPIPYDWSIKTSGHLIKHKIIVDHYLKQQTQYVYDLTYYQDILKSVGFESIKVIDGPDPRKHYLICQ